jgi:hypothetical protein
MMVFVQQCGAFWVLDAMYIRLYTATGVQGSFPRMLGHKLVQVYVHDSFDLIQLLLEPLLPMYLSIFSPLIQPPKLQHRHSVW